MDSLMEFSVLTELCSTNYSELLSAVYNKYSRSTRDKLLPIEGLLTSDDETRQYLLTKAEIDYFSLLHNRIFSALTDYDFRCHFKVSKTIAEELIEVFDRRQREKKWIGRPSMEVSRFVLIGLWFLVSNEPYRMLCDRFSIAIGHSNQTVRLFLSTLSSIKDQHIIWPKGIEAEQAELEFNEVNDVVFPRVIGCIDSCQVKARRNKTRVYSFIIMQAIADAKGRFTNVYCGEANEMSDTRVFGSSDIGKRLLSRPRSLMKHTHHILANEGYPLLTNVMVPFEDHENLTPKQRLYNELLEVYRSTVKGALGSLFGRFKRLGFLDLFKTNELSNAVTTACVIHNMCLAKGDDSFEPGLVAYGLNNFPDTNHCGPGAREKRDNLVEEIFPEEIVAV